MEKNIEVDAEDGGNKRHMLGHVFQKIRTNPEYKERVLLTLCIYLSFAVIGGTKGQLGPALLDLIAISGVDLAQGALIVTFLYIGYTIGAMLNGVLYHRFRRTSLFSFCCFGMGISTAAIPWCTDFALMLGMHAVLGLFQGVVDSGGNAEIIKLWTKDSRTMVVGLHLVFNIGGVLSPIIIAPFLMKSAKIQTLSGNEIYEEFAAGSNSGYNNLSTNGFSILRNSVINLSKWNDTFENTTFPIYTGRPEMKSRIYIAFVISAATCLLMSFLFLCLYLSKKWKYFMQSNNVATKTDEIVGEVSKIGNSKMKIPRTIKIVALSVMITISTLSKAIDHAFAAYVASFCVDALHWSTHESSYLTSVYFVSVVIGGMCGTIMTKVTSLIIYEGSQILLMLASFVCIAFSVTYSSSIGFWIGASLFGFAKSVVFALTLAWTNDSFVKISGKISSIFFTSTMAGSVTNPLLLGYIMANFSKIWFCYFFILESALLVIFYVIAVLLTKHVKHLHKSTDSEKFDTS